MSRRDRYTCTLERGLEGSIDRLVVATVDADGEERTSHLGGTRLTVAVDPVRRILKRGGVRGSQLAGSSVIDLDPSTGMQVELLIAAVSPLRRADRIALVGDRIAEMGSEEAAYWHAKTARRGGLQALRILLREGTD